MSEERIEPQAGPAEPKNPKASSGAFSELLRRNWPQILKPVTVLFCICLVVSALLAVTNYITAPLIAEGEHQRANASRLELLKADDFTQVEGSWEGVTEVYQAVTGGAVSGYVITGTARGYGGDVPVMVAFDTNGTIVGIRISGTSETQGLGAKVEETAFTGQFAGLAAKTLTLNTDVQQVAGATISSTAAITAVNNAVAAYNAVAGKEG